MQDFKFSYAAKIPEYVGVEFETNGSQGGDTGHGGYATLKINLDNGGMIVGTEEEWPKSFKVIEDVRDVRITVRGDWELESFAVAFFELGRALMARNDVIKNAVDYEDEENQ